MFVRRAARYRSQPESLLALDRHTQEARATGGGGRPPMRSPRSHPRSPDPRRAGHRAARCSRRRCRRRACSAWPTASVMSTPAAADACDPASAAAALAEPSLAAAIQASVAPAARSSRRSHPTGLTRDRRRAGRADGAGTAAVAIAVITAARAVGCAHSSRAALVLRRASPAGRPRRCAGTPWTLPRPARAATIRSRAFRRRSLWFAPALAALAVLHGLGIVVSVQRPLLALTHAAERIAAGDLSERIETGGATRSDGSARRSSTCAVSLRAVERCVRPGQRGAGAPRRRADRAAAAAARQGHLRAGGRAPPCRARAARRNGPDADRLGLALHAGAPMPSPTPPTSSIACTKACTG